MRCPRRSRPSRFHHLRPPLRPLDHHPSRKIPPCQQWNTSRPASLSPSGHGQSPFTIPHDAADPVGFVFIADGVRLGFATDLGYVTPNVKQQLKDLDLLLVESNHDLEMLRDGPYPWSVKQRYFRA